MGFREDAIKIIKSMELSSEERKEAMQMVDEAIKAEEGGEAEKSVEVVTLDELYKAREIKRR